MSKLAHTTIRSTTPGNDAIQRATEQNRKGHLNVAIGGICSTFSLFGRETRYYRRNHEPFCVDKGPTPAFSP